MLSSVTIYKTYQSNLEMINSIPEEVVPWILKEMQNNKKQVKYTISWFSLSIIAKMKVKESVGVDPDTRPSLDSSQFKV